MRLTVAIAALAALPVLACRGSADSGSQTDRVQAVTSLGILADFVRQVGGDRVDVKAVIPPGADPETFEPSPRDIRDVSQAYVMFINGGGLESAFERAIVDNLRREATLVRFAGLFEGGNPHFWLNVDNAALYAAKVAETLATVDPQNAALYRANLNAYEADLLDLSGEMKAAVSVIPPDRRKLVTAHDAFPHFADYLGLDLIGAAAPSEGQEPSPADLQRLVSAIEDQAVPAVFAEPGFTDKTLKQVAHEAAVPICTLYSDALDKRVTTYIDMMRFNAAELVRCLGGDAGG